MDTYMELKIEEREKDRERGGGRMKAETEQLQFVLLCGTA